MQALQLETLRRKIDAEVAELRSRILVLLSQRNDLSPIGRLPPEVLSKIFLEFRQCSELENPADFLTWICRDWRHVAIDCPALWSEIDFYHPPSVKVYLARSKNAPLELHLLHLYPRRVPTSVPLMLQHLPRCVVLRARRKDDHPTDETVQLGRALCLPAPLLRVLLLEGVELPMGVFSGQTPRLEQVAITSCKIHWKTMPLTLSNLTVLAIVAPVVPAEISDFLNILRHAPNLTELEFEDVFDHSSKLPEHPQQGPVVLPRLESLGVPQEESMMMRQFLRHVSLPNATEMKMTITTSPQNPTEFTAFVREYYTFHFLSKAILRLGLTYGTDYSIIRIFTHSCDDPDEPAPFHLNLHQKSNRPLAPNLSALSSAHLNLNSLQYLMITTAKDYPIQWVPLFGTLPHLRILEVTSFAARSFTDLLVEESRSVSTACPSLLSRYFGDLAEELSNTSPIPADHDAQTLLNKAGLSFRALENLRLVLPHPVHDPRAFPVGYDKLIIFNLFCRRICGIGLKKFTHMNWKKQTELAMNMAYRVVDDMQQNPNMEVEWFKP